MDMSTKQKRKPWSPLFTKQLRAMIALGKASASMLKRGYTKEDYKIDRRYGKAIDRVNAVTRERRKNSACKGKRS
jgi:hypothetical protein